MRPCPRHGKSMMMGGTLFCELGTPQWKHARADAERLCVAGLMRTARLTGIRIRTTHKCRDEHHDIDMGHRRSLRRTSSAPMCKSTASMLTWL